MANINLSRNTHVDYLGSFYFNAHNVQNFKATPKYAPATDKNPKPAILIHIEGVQTTSGILVDADIWPRNECTQEDIDRLFDKTTHKETKKDEEGKDVEVEVFDGYEPKKSVTDIIFRVGYYPKIDADGNAYMDEGQPKWIAYYDGATKVKLSGDKREFDER